MKKCIQCNTSLQKGSVAPHGGKDVYFRPDSGATSLSGFFKEAMKNSKRMDAYMCPKCGRVELYANL